MDAPAERAKFRRFSSHFTFGLVGFSSLGTVLLDEAFEKQAIPKEHFPFCYEDEMKKTRTRIDIHDERYERLCKYYKPKREVSAFLKIMNTVQLERGAYQGNMLDEEKLPRLQAVDAIFLVLSPKFTKDSITLPKDIMDVEDPNVSDSADFVEDLKLIRNELRFKDLEFMRRKVEDLEGSIQISSEKQLKIIHECCKKVKAWLEEGKDIRFGHWEDTDGQILSTFHLLTDKPVVYLVKVSKDDYQKEANEFLPNIHAWVQEHGGEPIILFSAVLEYKLSKMSKFEAAKYCEENKLVSAIPKIIKAGFSVLNSIYFYTAYPDEPYVTDEASSPIHLPSSATQKSQAFLQCNGPDTPTPSQISTNPVFYPFFKDCIGAIDGTYITAWVPIKDHQRYQCRKGFIAQNVMAIVGFDMLFQFVCVGFEGSANDQKVLTDVLQNRGVHNLQIPDGKYFLVDAGYGNRRGFIGPYRGTRYHLKEYGPQALAPRTPSELFNLRHAKLRNVIERTFGLWKVQSWLIRQTTAPQAAGAIHPDFEEGFVHAEVIKYEDLIELGTVAAVKDAGKCRVEGKTYVVQDGDIIFFKLNVSVAGRSEAIVPLE